MVDELIETNGYLGLLSLGGSESVRTSTENFVGTIHLYSQRFIQYNEEIRKDHTMLTQNYDLSLKHTELH